MQLRYFLVFRVYHYGDHIRNVATAGGPLQADPLYCGMKTMQAFFLHITAALVLLLAFCHSLPRAAFTLAYVLGHSPWYGIALLASAATARHQTVTWWRATVMQKAVGAKARHQRTQGARQ